MLAMWSTAACCSAVSTVPVSVTTPSWVETWMSCVFSDGSWNSLAWMDVVMALSSICGESCGLAMSALEQRRKSPLKRRTDHLNSRFRMMTPLAA